MKPGSLQDDRESQAGTGCDTSMSDSRLAPLKVSTITQSLQQIQVDEFPSTTGSRRVSHIRSNPAPLWTQNMGQRTVSDDKQRDGRGGTSSATSILRTSLGASSTASEVVAGGSCDPEALSRHDFLSIWREEDIDSPSFPKLGQTMSEDPLRVTHAGRPSGYVWDLSERGQDSEYTKDEAILDFPHEHRHPDVQHARTEKPQVETQGVSVNQPTTAPIRILSEEGIKAHVQQLLPDLGEMEVEELARMRTKLACILQKVTEDVFSKSFQHLPMKQQLYYIRFGHLDRHVMRAQLLLAWFDHLLCNAVV
mmetsp:Transcript_30994/g.59846  ORF Transcript_30994/g.59846 Transcript_30994/m.59846 type:complete len:308 (+) Transcript_30994:168-1091(+)